VSLGIDKVAGKAVLTGPWEAGYLKQFVASGADELIIGPAPDLEFLRELPPLKRLDVTIYQPVGVRPIESQSALRRLLLTVNYKTPIDFSRLPELTHLDLDWGPGAESIEALVNLEDLSVSSFRRENLSLLHNLDKVRRLRIVNSRRMTSLQGIEAIQSLEDARLLDLRNLTDLTPIAGVAKTLRSLEFNACRRIDRLDALRPLENLRTLHVLDCGDIESLAPVRGLPLVSMLFYESTNIRDGDLSVLLDIPTLREASYADRRHYSHRRDDLEALLSARR
jgi:hypothetical protein